MQWFQYLIAPLIAGAVAAFASTYLTARFSFNRFVQEQWWQARRDAYESIIRALSEIIFDSHSEFVRLRTGGEIIPPKAPDRERGAGRGLFRVHEHDSAAPRFVLFEAWAFLLVASGDFPQLGFLRFVHQHRSRLVKSVVAKAAKSPS